MATGSELASAWISIYPKFSKDFNSSVTSAVGNIGNSVANKLGTTMSVTLGNVFARVIDTALSTITQHAGDAIERADILNNFPIQMANFGYATSDAETAIDKLHDAVMGLPTALDTIANATARLAPMRNSLGDATDLAIALNNAIVAGGQSAVLQKNAMEQFSQMLAVNKVDVVAWRSVINAMPAQMQQLTDSIMGTGHSVWDLYHAMQSEDGKAASVTFEDFIEHLMKLNQEGINGLPSLAEQARNATFGIGTAMQNVRNRIADAGARIIDGIGRDRIANAINDVSKQFGGWADKTVGFIQAVETPTLGLAGSMLTLGSTIKNVIVQSGIINTQSIVDALYTMSDILDNHISPFISGFGGRLTSAVATLKDVLSEATRGFLDWYSTAKNAFNQSRGDLSAFGHGALELARQMGRDMLPVLKTMTATYIPLLSRGLAAAAGAAQSTYNRILPSLSRIANVIIPLVADGIQLITERFDAASDVFDTVADLAATAAEDFLPRLGALARDLLPHVDEALKTVANRARNVYDAIAPTFTSMADSIIPALGQAIDRVIKLINSPAIERVAVTVSEGIAGVLGTVIGQLDAVFDILEDVEGIAGDVIGDIVPRISQLAQTVLPRIVKAISVIVKTARDVYSKVAPPLGRLADAIIPAVGTALDAVVRILEGPIGDAFSRLASVAGNAIGTIADRFPGLFDKVMGVVNGPLSDSFGRIVDAATRCIETIGDRFPDVLGVIIDFIEGPVADAFVKVAGFAADVISGIADRLPTLLGYVERLWGVIEEIGNAVKPVFDTLFGSVSESAFQLLETVLTTLFGSEFSVSDPFGDVSKLDYVLDSFTRLADIFTGSLSDPFGGPAGKSFIIDFITDVANGVRGLIETLSYLARTVFRQLHDNLETIWGTFTANGGLPTVTGIFETIGKVITFVVTNVMDLFQAITNGIASLKPEVIERIKAAINRIGAALAKLWADNKGTILNLVERTVPLLAELLAVVAEGIAKIVETMAPNINDFIQNKLPGLMTKLSAFVSDTLPGLLDKVAALMGWLTPDRVWTITKIVAAFMALRGVGSILEGISRGLSSFDASINTVKDLVSRFKELSSYLGDIKDKASGAFDALKNKLPTAAAETPNQLSVVDNIKTYKWEDLSPEFQENLKQQFKKGGDALSEGLKESKLKSMSGAWESITGGYTDAFKKANASVSKGLDGIGSKLKGLGGKLVAPFSSAKGKIAEHLASIGTTISTAVAPKVASIGTTLGTSLGSLTGAFAGVGAKILSIVSGLGKAIVAVFTGPVGVAALIVAALIGAFVAFTPEGRKVFDDFVGRIKNMWDEKIVKPFNSFMETVKQVYEEKIKPHVDNLVKALEPAAKIIADTIGDAIEGIFDFVKGIFDFLNSPEGRPILDAIAEVIGAIIDALALLVRIVMTVFSIARRLSQLIVTISGNLIKAVHNFFDSIFNGGKDQWGYGEWTEPLHGLGEDLTSLWKDDKSFLAGPMNSFGEGLINVTDAIKENSKMTEQQIAQQDTSGALKDAYATTEEIRARQEAGLPVSNVSSQSPLNKPLNLNIDGKKVAQTTLPAVTTASGTYAMSYQRGM